MFQSMSTYENLVYVIVLSFGQVKAMNWIFHQSVYFIPPESVRKPLEMNHLHLWQFP
jgi:hypothetical protein